MDVTVLWSKSGNRKGNCSQEGTLKDLEKVCFKILWSLLWFSWDPIKDYRRRLGAGPSGDVSNSDTFDIWDTLSILFEWIESFWVRPSTDIFLYALFIKDLIILEQCMICADNDMTMFVSSFSLQAPCPSSTQRTTLITACGCLQQVL